MELCIGPVPRALRRLLHRHMWMREVESETIRREDTPSAVEEVVAKAAPGNRMSVDRGMDLAKSIGGRLAPRFRDARTSGRQVSSILLRRVGWALRGPFWAALLLGVQMCGVMGFCQESAASKGDLLNQAHALAVAGKFSQAETLLHKMLQQNANSADAHFLLGYIYFREQRARRSLAEFTSGARTEHPGVDDLRIVAADYVLLGDFPDAAKWFGVVASKEPQDPDNWYLLGRAQYNENRFQQSIASFKKVLALRPKDVRAENNLGLAWEGMNNVERATQAFHRAIEWQGDHPQDAQPYLNLGILLNNSAHPGKALPYLKSAVRLAPQNPKIREQLARAYKAQKDFAEAQRELEAAVKLAPKAAGLHYELGQVYWREGLHDKAQKQFKICAKLNGGHSDVATPNPYSPN